MWGLYHILNAFNIVKFPQLFDIDLKESSLKHLPSEHTHIHLWNEAVRENSYNVSSASGLVDGRVSYFNKAHLIPDSSLCTFLSHDWRVWK